MKEVDEKVKEYLNRAHKIAYAKRGKLANPPSTLEIMGIAKIIQREEHRFVKGVKKTFDKRILSKIKGNGNSYK